AAVVMLLGLGAANRFVLVPRFETSGGKASRALTTSIALELALAVVILALVVGWRFTAPPRALAAADHVSIHFHGDHAMTQNEVEPVRARGADIHVQVLDHELHPLKVKGVTLVFSRPSEGLEPLRREAVSEGDASWRIEGLRIPVGGRWHLRVEILITDFDKDVIEDDVLLPTAP